MSWKDEYLKGLKVGDSVKTRCLNSVIFHQFLGDFVIVSHKPASDGYSYLLVIPQDSLIIPAEPDKPKAKCGRIYHSIVLKHYKYIGTEKGTVICFEPPEAIRGPHEFIPLNMIEE